MKKLVIGLAPVLLAIGSSAVAATPVWRVSEASGDVRVVENGRPRVALRGALLASGATIVTGQGARAVIVRDHDFVVISPNSRMRIAEPVQQRGFIQVIADFGTALFRIEHKPTPHFGVQTPYLAAVVKGTVFTVTVGDEGSTVQVTEGAVEVATLDGGAVDLIRPGMIASVGANDRLQLSVKGDVNRVIRSNGGPVAGSVTVPAPAETKGSGGDGQARPAAEVTAPVQGDPVSLADATDGLVQGNPVETAFADANRPAKEKAERYNGDGSDNGSAGGGSTGSDNGNGGSGGGSGGSSGGSGGGSGGGGSDNGNGNGNGGGNGGNGNGGSNGGSGSGNGGSGGSGGGSDNSGSGGNGGSGGPGSGSGGSGGGGSDNSGSGGSGSGGSGGGPGGSGGSGSGGSDNSGSGGSGGSGSGGSGSGGSGGSGGSDDSGSGGSGSGHDGSGDSDNDGSGGHGGSDGHGGGHGGSGGGGRGDTPPPPPVR